MGKVLVLSREVIRITLNWGRRERDLKRWTHTSLFVITKKGLVINWRGFCLSFRLCDFYFQHPQNVIYFCSVCSLKTKAYEGIPKFTYQPITPIFWVLNITIFSKKKERFCPHPTCFAVFLIRNWKKTKIRYFSIVDSQEMMGGGAGAGCRMRAEWPSQKRREAKQCCQDLPAFWTHLTPYSPERQVFLSSVDRRSHSY